MGSVMFCGHVKSSKLPTLSSFLAPPLPPTVPVQSGTMVNGTKDETKKEEQQACLSLAAGEVLYSSLLIIILGCWLNVMLSS